MKKKQIDFSSFSVINTWIQSYYLMLFENYHNETLKKETSKKAVQ